MADTLTLKEIMLAVCRDDEKLTDFTKLWKSTDEQTRTWYRAQIAAEKG